MALLFYVQTVIDVTVDFFLRLESLFSSSGGGGIYFINCGCPSGNVRYCLSSQCMCSPEWNKTAMAGARLV